GSIRSRLRRRILPSPNLSPYRRVPIPDFRNGRACTTASGSEKVVCILLARILATWRRGVGSLPLSDLLDGIQAAPSCARGALRDWGALWWQGSYILLSLKWMDVSGGVV